MIRTLYLLRGSIVSRADRRPVDSDRKLAKKEHDIFLLPDYPFQTAFSLCFNNMGFSMQ